MTEIPEDIMKAAQGAIGEVTIDDGTIAQYDALAERISLAILAERQRCERVEKDREKAIGALRVLADVHLGNTEHTDFHIKIGAAPEYGHDRQAYVDAWGVVHTLVKWGHLE